MAAEIVVVVQDEDARRWAGGLAEVPGRRQAADAGANDDQIVTLARVGRRARRGPERAVAQRVRDLEGAGVAAPETGERWRIGRPATCGIVEAEPERGAR